MSTCLSTASQLPCRSARPQTLPLLQISCGSPLVHRHDHTLHTNISTCDGSVKLVAYNYISQLQRPRPMLCKKLSVTYSGLTGSPASTCLNYRYDQPATTCTFHSGNPHFHRKFLFDLPLNCKTVIHWAPLESHHPT